jgi:hypothetical protein
MPASVRSKQEQSVRIRSDTGADPIHTVVATIDLGVQQLIKLRLESARQERPDPSSSTLAALITSNRSEHVRQPHTTPASALIASQQQQLVV